jgi:hypothetical protein
MKIVKRQKQSSVFRTSAWNGVYRTTGKDKQTLIKIYKICHSGIMQYEYSCFNDGRMIGT